MKTIIKKIKKLGLRLGIKKLIGYEAIFSCAFCERVKGAELYKKVIPQNKIFHYLPHSDKYWYADPLVCEKDGKEVVFLECVNRKTGIGCIACSDISDGKWEEPIPIIEESFHMSFPMCFTWHEKLYMIPETEMSESINLYHCIEFPYKWEKIGTYLQGLRLVDSVILTQTDEAIKFLASEYNPADDFFTRFHCYEMFFNKNEIQMHDLGRVTEHFTLNSRAAGPIIHAEENLLPLQRSTSGIYGYSVQFNTFSCNIPGKITTEILPHDIHIKGKKLIGVHTYSQSTHYEVLDIQYLVFNKNKWRER